jgi:hypothetical protein
MFRVGDVKHSIEVVREPCFGAPSPRRRAFWLCSRCKKRRQHLYLDAADAKQLLCRECIGDGAGLVYTVRTISNDERRQRAALFGASATKRKRRDRRSVEQRAAEGAVAELLKARHLLRPIDLLLVSQSIRNALEFITGLDRLNLDREQRRRDGVVGPPPAPAEPVVGAEP